MDKQRGIELLNEASRIYCFGGMYGFEQWVRLYQGENTDKQYLLRVCEIIREMNSNPCTRLFSIDKFVIQDVLERLKEKFTD